MTGNDSIPAHKCARASIAGQPGQPQSIQRQPLNEPPASAPTQKSIHDCTSCPPISPCSVMNGTVILSNRLSKNPDKKIQAERYMSHIQHILKKYHSDEHASKYLTDVFSLVLKQSSDMYDSRQNNNRKLDKEDEVWRLKETSLEDIKKSETQKLEDYYGLKLKNLMERRISKIKTLEDLSTPVSIKGSLTRLIGAGGITSLLIASQKEITKMIQKYIPDFANFTYLAFFVTAGIMVVGTTKLIGAYFEKRLRVTKEGFNNDELEIKKNYNDEKQALIKKQEERDESAYKLYVNKKAEIEKEDYEYRQARAAFVYIEAFKLCESFYPEYTKKYTKYAELKEKEPEKAMDYISEHAQKLSKADIIAEPIKGSLTV